MIALIIGVTGQDGAYLAKHLLENGYEVWGGYRRSASPTDWRLKELGIADDVRMVAMDVLEYENVRRTIALTKPDEVYNLAAQSFVPTAFEVPLYTADVTGLGALRVLEAIRAVDSGIRFYQASSSEMFGKVRKTPQTETTPFHPRSPYSAAKAFAHYATVNYREAHGLHATSGILFNHESPLRGEEFVTRKITATLARIACGSREVLRLGNLDARRDWGHAADYVKAMAAMLRMDKPDDYVIATGETHTVLEFVRLAIHHAGLTFGGTDPLSIQCQFGDEHRDVVVVDPALFRPAEVDVLQGDASKARRVLGWEPTISFESLVAGMMHWDLDRVRQHGSAAP